jgi:MOSC domain-containing protein YiiM
MIAPGTLQEVRIGVIARLENAGRGGAGIDTAYRKQPVAGPVMVGALGLAGDHQANRKYHGGPEKAVYGYPLSGYAAWRAEFPALADRFGPGAMGENLVVVGQDEASLCIGDVICCGTATLQIAQIRQPCSTLGAIFGSSRIVRAMTRSGRCGWYYRVIETGQMAAGDGHDVIDRPNPDWPVSRLADIAAGRAGTIAALEAMTVLPGLAAQWQQWAKDEITRQTHITQ